MLNYLLLSDLSRLFLFLNIFLWIKWHYYKSLWYEGNNCTFVDLAKPQLDTSLTNVTLKEGEVLNISCSSNSLPAADITWVNASNAIIRNSNNFILNPISRNDVGLYSCNATNIVGTSTSDSISVTVHCKFENH